MRDAVAILGLVFVGFMLAIFLSGYYTTDYKQESYTMGLNETVRATALASIDNSSRVSEGKVFLIEDKFEESLKERVKANIGLKFDTEPTYEFEYLKNTDGSLKALKVRLIVNGEPYQTTYRVDIAE